MKTKLIASLLSVIFIVSVLAGCGEVTNPEETTKAGGLETQATETTAAAETTDFGTLGEKNWEGRTCEILGVYDSHEPSFEIYADGDASDNISVSIYKRNSYLQLLYNFEIKQVGDEAAYKNFDIDVASGTASYDIVFRYRDDMPTSISKNSFVDLSALSYIDFSQPYYNANTIESMKIGGKLYHMVSDFSLVDKNRIASMFVNRDLANDYKIPDVITDVKNGSWTLEKFNTYVQQTSEDKDADGKMSYLTDQFGLTIGSADECIGFWSATGCKYISMQKDGSYILDYGSQRSLDAVDKIRQTFTNTNYYFASTSADGYSGAGECFRAGRALFMAAVLSDIPTIAQETSFSYSVIPFPKLDENQERYYSNNNNRFCATFGIPTCAADKEFSAFVIEALSWQSTETTLATYYEINCKARNSYDALCAEMMDVLFDALDFDFGFMYDGVLNTPKSTISNGLRSKTIQLSNMHKKNSSREAKTIDKLLTTLNGTAQ